MAKAQKIYRECRRTLPADDARYLTLALLGMTVAEVELLRT